jgi:Xaa-Pro aminopeptidase
MILSRKEQIARALQQAGLDALVCALPKNVLMLSGYWPVVGTGVAVAARPGDVHLLIPEDEKQFAQGCRATTIETFKPGSLDEITTASDAVVAPLSHVLKQFLKSGVRIGHEHGGDSEPASYSAMHLYQGALRDVIGRALPSANTVSADDVIRNLLSIKDEDEQNATATACRIAGHAFQAATATLRPGITEVEAAANIQTHFAAALRSFPSVQRAEAFIYVMSGQNSFKAHAAFAHSSTKMLEPGDLVLVHCNSFANGFATDITRTFSLGAPDERRQAMYQAIFVAREAAFGTLSPGTKARDVDHAARSVLDDRGCGRYVLHSTGHGVGFGAISPNALPRIHPKSDDVLEPGMVFNIEPAIYIEGYGGMRHCDMVAITETGFKLLTDFQNHPENLVVHADTRRASQ